MIEIRPIASSSRANAYYVSDGKTPLLIECGLRFKDLQQKLNFKLSDLGGCLLSHEHKDHSRAVKSLLVAGVDCYMSAGTQAELDCENHHRAKKLIPHIPKRIGSWWVIAFPTIHDAREPLGFILMSGDEKILFATDTAYLKLRMPGCTRIMVECNYQEEILQRNIESGLITIAQRDRLLWSHFSLSNVLKMLQANDLSQLTETWLLHLSRDNSDAEEMRRAVQETTGKPVYVCHE